MTNIHKKKQLDPSNLSERDRVKISANVKDFSFRNYVAYAIYAPLYLVGPILTFNDYICQSKYRVASIETPRTIRYAVRFLLVLLAMEIILHYDYVGAISKAAPVWNDYTPAQLSMLSFMNLHIIWLKLLLPWRLFRLWALIDGMDPPENMVRCVSNNYSMQLFWRAWHRSYNRWLIRYIYVPLGGSSFRGWRATVRSVATFLMVFTFVALWHDIQLRLLIWGWLIVLFMLPEWTATWAFPKRKWESHPTEYRILCGVGAVISVLMMITANLVGFAFGLDGLETILRAILHDWSGKSFIPALNLDVVTDQVFRDGIHSDSVFMLVCRRTSHVRGSGRREAKGCHAQVLDHLSLSSAVYDSVMIAVNSRMVPCQNLAWDITASQEHLHKRRESPTEWGANAHKQCSVLRHVGRLLLSYIGPCLFRPHCVHLNIASRARVLSKLAVHTQLLLDHPSPQEH